jgi:membrane protein
MHPLSFWKLLRESFTEWRRDNASQLAASTAYYTVFSIAPLLIIVISLVGLLLEEAEVEAYLLQELQSLAGDQGMGAVASMLDAAERSPHTPMTSFIGFTILVFGASSLMASLQNSFNRIWKVETHPEANTIVVLFLKRVFSLGMILTLGFLLLVSLVMSAVVSIAVEFVANQLPAVAVLLPVAHVLLSFLAITLLFAVFFKFLPDIRTPWKAVVPGAALTALLFTLGKVVLGTFLGQWDFTSAYGVAGSIIVLLLWINYSAQAMFLGAEFTKVYARDTNTVVYPRSYARFRTTSAATSARRNMLWGAATDIAFAFPKLQFTWSVWKRFRKVKKWLKR